MLTKRRLQAIIEALTERLAGEIDNDIPLKDYEGALEWAQKKMAEKELRTGTR